MDKRRINSILKFLLIFFIMLTLVFTLTTCILGMQSDSVDWDNVRLVQLEQPQDGAQIAIITTNLGEMRAVLYPEYAPKAVKNFISLAKQGYYDNTYVFGVQQDTFFLAGTPNKNGELNDDYDKDNENISKEIHDNLWPFRGAICSLSGSGERSGSRFMVCNSIDMTEEIKSEMLDAGDNKMLAEAFIAQGGIPNYSRQYTVIAQVYEGYEVIDKICAAEVETGEDDALIPKEDIMIEKIVISDYSE